MLKKLMKRIAAVFTLAICLPGLASAEGWYAGKTWYAAGPIALDVDDAVGLKFRNPSSRYAGLAASVTTDASLRQGQGTAFFEVHEALKVGMVEGAAYKSSFGAPSTPEHKMKVEVAAWADEKIRSIIDEAAGNPFRDNAVSVALGEDQGRVVSPYSLMDLGAVAAHAEDALPTEKNIKAILLAGEEQGRVVAPFNMLQLAAHAPGFESIISDF